MSSKKIRFHEYLINLGAKKNWFEKESKMRSELYFQRKIYDGSMIDEIGIKSQSILSKLFYNVSNYLPISKIFPKNSKNLYSFNMYAFHDSDFPFKQVLYSSGSFEEIEKNFLLALNEIEKRDINAGKEEEDDYWLNEYYENHTYEEYHEDDEDEEIGIFEKNKINILNLSYPETYDVDPKTGYGSGNLSIFDLEYKRIHFLNKPLNGQYFLLWGNEKEVKYFLPIKFIIDTDWIDVIIKN